MLPPIFTILVVMYTIRGAMLVFGGVWLNVLLVGAVIRPIKESSTRTDLISSTETPDLENIEIGASEETEQKASRQTSKHLLNANDNLNFELRHSTLSLGLQPLGINTFMASSRQSLDRILAGGRLQRHRYNISAPCLPLASNFGKVNADPSDSTTTDANEDTSHPEQDQHENRAPDERLAGVTSKVVVGCCELVHEAFVLSKKVLEVIREYWAFIRSPGLPMLMFAFFAASFAYFNQFFIFPPLAHELGMTKFWGAMLVSVSNVTELISRLVVGILVDKDKVTKACLIQVSFMLSAVLAMAVSFSTIHTILFVYSALFGLLGGVFLPLAILILVELVPETHISSASGLFALVTGTGISLGPSVLGEYPAKSELYLLTLCVIQCPK